MVPRTDGCREERRDDHGLGVQRRHAVVVVYFAGLDPGAVEGCGGVIEKEVLYESFFVHCQGINLDKLGWVFRWA